MPTVMVFVTTVRAMGQCVGFVDANGDGICDNRGTNGQGAGYVDADGDGVCDNRAAGGGMMRGQERGMGRGAGGGCMR